MTTLSLTPSAITAGPWKVHRVHAAFQRAYVHTDRPHTGGISIAVVGGENDGEHLANARLIAAAPDLRRDSQRLYDAIQAYLIDVPDRDLPADLVDAFDAVEAAWRKADGTPAGV